MSVIVLCTIGNRDVAYDGAPLARPRDDADHLLATYDNARGHLSLPIVEPCLRYAAKDAGRPIEAVHLFGTEQDDAEHSARDTFKAAQLAARYIKDANLAAKCSARQIKGINPALYDEAYKAFEALVDSVHADDTADCYVVPVGGTPACSMAIVLQAVRRFGRRTHVIYLASGGDPIEVQIAGQILEAHDKAALVRFMGAMDFAKAQDLIANVTVDAGVPDLVTYAVRRLEFDFETAQAFLRQANSRGTPPVRQFIRNHLYHDLDVLLNGVATPDLLRAQWRELYWNAHLTYRHGRYADFLGRVFRLQESVLRFQVESIYGLPTDAAQSARDGTVAAWEKYISATPQLAAYLGTLDWRKLSRPVFSALVRYACAATGNPSATGDPLLSTADRESHQQVLSALDRLEGLANLRNNFIIAHGFRGVSAQDIQAALGASAAAVDPCAVLALALAPLGIDTVTDPYRQIADFVLEQLR